jgi:hypothetical protein
MTKLIIKSTGNIELYFSGDFSDSKGFVATSVSVAIGVTETIHFSLSANFAIDKALVIANAPNYVFDLSPAHAVLKAELCRQLARIDVDFQQQDSLFLGVKHPLGNGALALSAEIRLNLVAVLFPTQANTDALIQFSVLGSAELSVGNQSLDSRLALACAISANLDLPTLRVDLHDLHLSLPDIQLNQWVLSTQNFLLQAAAKLPLLNVPYFPGLALSYTIPANTKIAFQVQNDELDWGIFQTTVNWGAPNLAKLSANLGFGGNSIAFDNITAIQKNGRAEIGNLITAIGTLGPSGGVKGSKILGPIKISWEGVSATLVGDTTSNPPLALAIEFSRLQIEVIDDPSAIIAFKGEVVLTQSSVKVVSLELVAPYPVQLIADVQRALNSLISVFIDLAKASADQAKEFLRVLGLIAIAMSKAAAFVAGQVAQALAAIAELISDAISKLGELIATAGSSLAVELRISTDPMQICQVLITRAGLIPTTKQQLDALGLSFEIEPGWRPALLLDFVNSPGAYWVISRESGGEEIGSVSTDLWLKQGESTQSLRDADPATGDRPSKPLIKISLTQVLPATELMIVLTGLSRGQSVFLKRFVGLTKNTSITGGQILRHLAGGYSLVDFRPEEFKVTVDFEKDRILPLLGLSEPPESKQKIVGQPTFFDQLKGSLGNVVWLKKQTQAVDLLTRQATINLLLGVKAAGVETEVDLQGNLSLDSFEFKLNGDIKGANIKSKRIENQALGLTWIIEQADETERQKDTEIEMFQIGFSGSQSGMVLNRPTSEAPSVLTGKARMEVRFSGLSADGKGIAFEVEEFSVSSGGLNLKAKVKPEPVRLNGLDVPFRFYQGDLEIKNGRLVHASAEGCGSLPSDLIGEAACSISLSFAAGQDGAIELQSGQVQLEKMGEPIVCHGMRFTLNITDIGLGIIKDRGYHFFFQVSGSLRFTPKGDEFSSGLLQYLNDVEIVLERAPLAADPSVLQKHISFQKALNPKKTFNLFNLFTFELRGFGYHPASPKFSDAPPAMNISGQISFVPIGDVMQPSIDFHGLWMALPAEGESLPRIKADGLTVDLNLKGAIKVRGSLLTLDKNTRTIEGIDYAPKGYDIDGFVGSGELDIPGFGSLSASMGFTELESQSTQERKKSFFIYGEKKRMAVEITTPLWVFYLREFGFGFGFRYTLAALAATDETTSVAKQILVLDKISKIQGDLHKPSAWKAVPEGDTVTLALKGAMQTMPANKTYDEEVEKIAQELFFFDIVAMIRSDLTLLMAARGWLGTNYHDYQSNTEDLRSNPGFRGYLYISAPQKRLLLRAIGDSRGFIGNRQLNFAKDPVTGVEPPLRRALRAIDWSSTLYIKPGLFHYELGWPNELSVRLIDEPNMKVSIRGGMIFRAADDGLLWAYNLEADAYFKFGGELSAGSFGLAAEAVLKAHLIARVLAYLSFQTRDSMLYGLISLDASLQVSFRAWLEVDLGFDKFRLRNNFSLGLQLSAAIEMVIGETGIGARVNARVGVSVFGRTVSIGIGFEFNPGQLVIARQRVNRFLAMSITSEQPDTPPAVAHEQGITSQTQSAITAAAPSEAPAPTDLAIPVPALPNHQNPRRAWLGTSIRETNFWCVLRKASVDPEGNPIPEGDEYAYAMLVPKEAILDADKESNIGNYNSAFYCSPIRTDAKPEYEIETKDLLANCFVLKAEANIPVPNQKFSSSTIWANPVENDANEERFQLNHLFDECFLYDADWTQIGSEVVRKTTTWTEPPPQLTQFADLPEATDAVKVEQRDRSQRLHTADAARDPTIDQVMQARSTVLSLFFEQFKTLTQTGVPDNNFANVIDTGLVFYGPVDELEKLATASIVKLDQADRSLLGEIELLNPRAKWFDLVDPALEEPASSKKTHGDAYVTSEGIKLAWNLKYQFQLDVVAEKPDHLDAEHFLECYEIRREIEGFPSSEPKYIKRADTLGGTDSNFKLEVLRAEWQYTDDLADVPAEVRRALLPTSELAASFESAVAWTELYGDLESIDITYSVVPRDIAGTTGYAKGFVAKIARPQPPLRAAEAELRFLVDPGIFIEGTSDGIAGLTVFMALRDDAAKWDKEETYSAFGKKLIVTRTYELIADPEDIVPSGNYGSDALTERKIAPPSQFIQSPDQLIWELDDKFTSATISKAQLIEPDEDYLKKFPRWRLLAGINEAEGTTLKLHPPTLKNTLSIDPTGQVFLRHLISRNGDLKKQKVSTRFWLRTVQTVRTNVGGSPMFVSKSKQATPVSIEVQIKPNKKPRDSVNKFDISVMRPLSFECPHTLHLSPTAPNQIRTNVGFAQLRMPVATSSIFDLLTPDKTPITLVRDPLRRVMTEVEFFSHPLNQTAKEHNQLIAGYDLHELDIDELAPLDTASEPAFAKNVRIWKRARRVAHIQRISPAQAKLLPGDNRDWQGWQAHYPSETWRLENRSSVKNSSRPIRAAWYSAAESSIAFARREPRLRFFKSLPSGLVETLISKGLPSTLEIQLLGNTSITKQANFALYPYGFEDNPKLNYAQPPSCSGSWELKKEDAKPFSIDELNRTLLSLGWALERNSKAQEDFRKDPKTLVGLQLSITAKRTISRKGTTGSIDSSVNFSASLEFNSFMHPVIEETLEELSYDEKTPYRRYVVTAQSVLPIEDESFAAFIANSSSEVDPYGWRTLQQLGLAATISLYDLQFDETIDAKQLLTRLGRVFDGAVARYKNVYGDDSVAMPIVEVLLKPMKDRKNAPFYSVISETTKRKEQLIIEDSGLAIAQISLRPKPFTIWKYYGTTLKLDLPLYFSPAKDSRHILVITNGTDEPITVMRDHDGLNWQIESKATQRITVTNEFTTSLQTNFHNLFRFIVRVSNAALMDAISFELESIDKQGVVRSTWFGKENWVEISSPEGKDTFFAFDRLPSLNVDQWVNNSAYKEAVETLRQTLKRTAPDLDWAKATPTPAAFKATISNYLNWSQRFLDHSHAPTSSPLPFALAAPIKAQPWQLAPEADGCLRLSFLHQDRWSHTRAYAIRPTSRYSNIMEATGYETAEDNAGLGFKGDKPTEVGYALAVSPRTEKIEPPLFLDSRLRPSSTSAQDWEIVVARHSEEDLAFSNRPLFAHLGTEGTALAFIREYREPTWPTVLTTKFAIPEAVIYPIQPSENLQHQLTPLEFSGIDGIGISELAARKSSFWKGADVWRVPNLLPHYRVMAIATARAGVVVSRVVKTTLDATPRKDLIEYKGTWQQGTLDISKDYKNETLLNFAFQLVAYADVAQEGSYDNWLSNTDTNNIAWWPDPAIQYQLIRTTGSVEDEIAMITLSAKADPVDVRCRNSKFSPSSNKISVTTNGANPPIFEMQFALSPTLKNQAVRAYGLNSTVPQRNAFRTAAAGIAGLHREITFKVNMPEPAPLDVIKKRAKDIKVRVSTTPISGTAQPELLQYFQNIVDDTTSNEVELLQKLNKEFVLLCSSEGILEINADDSLNLRINPTGYELLTVSNLPSASATVLILASQHPFAKEGEGLFWRIAKQMLMGSAEGLIIRAIDTRNPIRKKEPGGWDAPGTLDIQIETPAW